MQLRFELGRVRLSSICSKCLNKKDIGSDWICCSDCFEFFIIEVKSKFGYCQMDVYLSVQLKFWGENLYLLVVWNMLYLWIFSSIFLFLYYIKLCFV